MIRFDLDAASIAYGQLQGFPILADSVGLFRSAQLRAELYLGFSFSCYTLCYQAELDRAWGQQPVESCSKLT